MNSSLKKSFLTRILYVLFKSAYIYIAPNHPATLSFITAAKFHTKTSNPFKICSLPSRGHFISENSVETELSPTLNWKPFHEWIIKNDCIWSWKIKSLMSPKLIISKQRKEYVEWMTAKMNLRANKTGEILIWSCPLPAVKSLMNMWGHSLSWDQGVSTSTDLGLVKGNGSTCVQIFTVPLILSYSLFPISRINTVIEFPRGSTL